MLKRLISVALVMLLLIAPGISADRDSNSLEYRNNTLTTGPEMLGVMVLDQKVKLMMRDGTYVEGKVIQASPESITLKVKKTEPKDRFPEKKAVIATSEIGSVYLRKGGSIAAPIALGVVGGILGTSLTAFAGRNVESQGYIGVVIAGATGGSVGGALLGREIVKKTLTINIQQPRKD